MFGCVLGSVRNSLDLCFCNTFLGHVSVNAKFETTSRKIHLPVVFRTQKWWGNALLLDVSNAALQCFRGYWQKNYCAMCGHVCLKNTPKNEPEKTQGPRGERLKTVQNEANTVTNKGPKMEPKKPQGP